MTLFVITGVGSSINLILISYREEIVRLTVEVNNWFISINNIVSGRALVASFSVGTVLEDLVIKGGGGAGDLSSRCNISISLRAPKFQKGAALKITEKNEIKQRRPTALTLQGRSRHSSMSLQRGPLLT